MRYYYFTDICYCRVLCFHCLNRPTCIMGITFVVQKHNMFLVLTLTCFDDINKLLLSSFRQINSSLRKLARRFDACLLVRDELSPMMIMMMMMEALKLDRNVHWWTDCNWTPKTVLFLSKNQKSQQVIIFQLGSNAALQTARKSEFSSSFFRVPSSECSSELGSRNSEIYGNSSKQIKRRNLMFSDKLIGI